MKNPAHRVKPLGYLNRKFTPLKVAGKVVEAAIDTGREGDYTQPQ